MKKIHYPNLNFLRCFAAFLVIIHHTEQLKNLHGYKSLWGYQPVVLIGKLGVDLFFVLSGFLITSLLYVEKSVVNKIQIKKFLMRRVLRIWPLYFLIMLIAFFITPHISVLQLGAPFISPIPQFSSNLIQYVLFLPQIQVFLIGPIAYCSQAWSIGIEEYFYLMWPFVVQKFKIRQVWIFTILFIIAYVLICRLSVHLLYTRYIGNQMFTKITECLQHGLKFDCLILGGGFALINSGSNYKLIKIITHPVFQILVYITEIVLVVIAEDFGGYFWEVHALLYGFIILNLVRSDTSIVNMEYRIFDFLGKISYGLYMYHFLVINILIKIVYSLEVPFLLYPLTFILVTLIASLSYKYVESYFLKKKITYSNILTG